jgi:hypothetical protein
MAKIKAVAEKIESKNKALVLEAFDTVQQARLCSRRAFLVELFVDGGRGQI